MLRFSLQHARFALRLDVQLEVGRETVALVGPSGAGKTTLFKLLLGVLTPDAGRIDLGGEAVFDRATRIDVAPEHRRIGYLPQDYALFPHLTAAQNVRFGLTERRGGRGGREAALELLERLGAAHLSDRRPHQLSGGERQRVALARALATQPRALLLDEPLSALDVTSRLAVRASLAEQLSSLGLPALVITHDPEDAAQLGQRIAVMEEGRLVQLARFEDLRASPASAFVRDFTR